jgi:hypothetical protein
MRAAKIDENQPEIVSCLRELGYSVQHLHTVGGGVPDLLVGKFGKNWLIEVKDGSKPPSKRALTHDQLRWHNLWLGQVSIVCSVDDVLEFAKWAK